MKKKEFKKMIDKNGVVLEDGDRVLYEGAEYTVSYSFQFGVQVTQIMRKSGGYWMEVGKKPNKKLEKVITNS